MFKKLRLSFHFSVLYGILGISLIGMFVSFFVVVERHGEVISEVDHVHFPLARTVAEIARYQMEQSLHLNALLLAARIEDQERFELANAAFVKAGKRLMDEMIVGRSTIQKGMDTAQSNTLLDAFKRVSALFATFKKAHVAYETVGKSLVRHVFEYDFLSKQAFLLSGDAIAAEEEAAKHVAAVGQALVDQEKTIRRLGTGLQAASEQIKQLSQTLALQAKQDKRVVLSLVAPVLLAVLVAGLVLVVVFTRLYSDQEKRNNRLTSQAMDMLSGALKQLYTTCRVMGPSSQRLDQTIASQQGVVENVFTLLTDLLRLSKQTFVSSEKYHALIREKEVAMQQTGALIGKLHDDMGDVLEAGVEGQRAVRALRDGMVRIDMLASHAHAEAVRSEATGSFSVFTQEIKALASANVTHAAEVSRQVDETVKGGHADRLRIIQINQKFSDMVVCANQEAKLCRKMAALGVRQDQMLQTVQRATEETQAAFKISMPLLKQLDAAGKTLKERLEVANNALGRWPGGPSPGRGGPEG